MSNHYSMMSEYLRQLADAVGHDGGSAAECDHCQLRGIAADIDRLGERSEAAEAEVDALKVEVSRLRVGLLSEQHENDEGLRWHVLSTRSFDELIASNVAAEARADAGLQATAAAKFDLAKARKRNDALEAEVKRLRAAAQAIVAADDDDHPMALSNAIEQLKAFLANTSQDAP